MIWRNSGCKGQHKASSICRITRLWKLQEAKTGPWGSPGCLTFPAIFIHHPELWKPHTPGRSLFSFHKLTRHYFNKKKKAPSFPSSPATAFSLRRCYSEVNSSDSPPGQTVISSSNSWAALKLSLKYHWSPVCWALPPSRAYPVLSPPLPFCFKAKCCRVEGQAVSM